MTRQEYGNARQQHPQPVNDKALYKAIYDKKWSHSYCLLRHPDVLRLVRFKGEHGAGPLHRACWRNAPVEIVRKICQVDAYTNMQNDRLLGRTPLHYACSGASEEVVALLLEFAPWSAAVGSIAVNANRGELPLHHAVLFNRSPSLLRRLLQVYPNAVHTSDSDGSTPLQLFIDNWRPYLEEWQHDPNGLPTGHHLDGNMDGLSLVRDTLILLMEAAMTNNYDNNNSSSSASTTSDDGNCSSTTTTSCFKKQQQSIVSTNPIISALQLKTYHGITIPPNFIQVFDRTTHLDCVRPDLDRNFALHVACANLTPVFIPADSNNKTTMMGNLYSTNHVAGLGNCVFYLFMRLIFMITGWQLPQ